MNSLHSANGAGPSQRRASSGQIMSPTTKTFANGPPSPAQEKPPVTAASVAKDCLQAELDSHHGASSSTPTGAVVILNDAVYGHRFSRPRTSRSALSTIVERPERIKAGVLGISMAYIRLGERHSEGSVPLHPKRDVHTLPSIPFRIHKTTRRLPLLSPAVTNVHGTKWMDELKMMCESAESRLAMGGKELQRRPRSRGEESAPEKLHEGDLYLCSESLDAIEGALGAVCEGIDTVFGPGPRRAFVGVRPPGHHCSASHPSGFCWVNNVHVGIMYGILNHSVTHAAIIDFDLHHGDGSQAITWQHNSRSVSATKNASPWKKTSIGYFSLHDINSYPCEGGDDEKVKNASLCIDNAHGQNIWNVHLHSWKTEQEFWELYESKYSVLLEKTRNYLKNQAQRLQALGQAPKAAIFFSAGFDASEWESAGMQRHQVNVPTEFYARISQDVVKLAAEEGLGVDGRVISVLEGGYSDRALFSGTCSHLSGLVGSQNPSSISSGPDGLGSEMSRKIGAVSEEPGPEQDSGLSSTTSYHPSWWASPELDKLESLIAKPLEPPKKPRQSTPSTYSSPTQASTAKVNDPIKMRRSLSGLSTASKAMARPASPPPPEVPWTIATHELSKLLIPSDRQTESCKPEDLNAEATRARQARQSTLTGTTPVATPERSTSKMALRGRKPKPIVPIDEEDLTNNRRKTVATTTAAPAKVASHSESVGAHANIFVQATPRSARTVPNAPQSARRSSRRLSGASTLVSPAEDVPPLPISSEISGASSVSRSTARPELATTGRSQSAGTLPVKKTRAPARKETAPKSARAKKTTSAAAAGSKAPTTSDEQAPQKPTEGYGDGMENITSGMKKIKINLITQSQKEARDRARAQEASSSAPTPSEGRSTRSGRSTPIVSPTLELASAVTSYGSNVEPSTPSALPASDPSYMSAAPGQPLTKVASEDQEQTLPEITRNEPDSSSMPASSPSVPQVSIQPSSDPADVFIPYQPEGPTPIAADQSEPLKWLPPNVPTPSANTPAATPSPVKKRDNLFHYTPGSIPFAPRPKSPTKTSLPPPQEAADESKAGAGSPAVDLPETPSK